MWSPEKLATHEQREKGGHQARCQALPLLIGLRTRGIYPLYLVMGLQWEYTLLRYFCPFRFCFPADWNIMQGKSDSELSGLGSAGLRKQAKGKRLSIRISVLGSGSRGNSTWIRTERTGVLVDAGFGRKETARRLAEIGERLEDCTAILISHEHSDHVNGLRSIARRLKVPVYLNSATLEAARSADQRFATLECLEVVTAGQTFAVGDIEIHAFSIPHDAAEPMAFTFKAHGIKTAVVTDLGYIPEVVKQHVRGCHCLVWESNHDLEMLKVGPYPWFVKQRVMGRQGHLSNLTTARFLTEDFDGSPQVLVLAHLSETNNHPEIVRLTAREALMSRSDIRLADDDGQAGLFREGLELILATQSAPTRAFVW